MGAWWLLFLSFGSRQAHGRWIDVLTDFSLDTTALTGVSATFTPVAAASWTQTAVVAVAGTYGTVSVPSMQLQPLRGNDDLTGNVRFQHIVDDDGPVQVQDGVPAVVLDDPGANA